MKKRITMDFIVPDYIDPSQIAHVLAEQMPKYAYPTKSGSAKYKVCVEPVRGENTLVIEEVEQIRGSKDAQDNSTSKGPYSGESTEWDKTKP